jgi:hypothetical protein
LPTPLEEIFPGACNSWFCKTCGISERPGYFSATLELPVSQQVTSYSLRLFFDKYVSALQVRNVESTVESNAKKFCYLKY